MCVKKNEPGNCCKGSCYLKKELDKEQKRENSFPFSNVQEKAEVLFCSALAAFMFFSPFISRINYSPYSFSETAEVFFSVFHPPKGMIALT